MTRRDRHPPVTDTLDELRLLQGIVSMGARFREGRDADKVLRDGLKLAMETFDAAAGCVATVPPGHYEAELHYASPRETGWDRHLLAGFVRGEKVPVPSDEMFARVRRRARMWGILAVRAPGRTFGWEERRALSAIASAVTDIAQRMDQERIREVRSRIDRKIMEQIRPKDLFYQILHGLRTLTEYDHSAMLLIANDEVDALEVVAEQVAWRKGKGRRVGERLALEREVRELLRREGVYGFRREGGAWHEWSDRPVDALAALMSTVADEGDVAESTMICAPLVSRDGVLGLLKISAIDIGTLGRYEEELVSRFLPQASVALQNARRTESLEMKMLAAERQSAMANLARGVSHDVNNALGAVLPLVQQMQEEASSGAIDPAVMADDLREIHRSLQVCRRIFSGMLSFAKGAARHDGEVLLHVEVETTLGLLREGMTRREIVVEVDVPDTLPPLRGVPADIEQLLLNLLTNARDAMARGGRLTVTARRHGNAVETTIADTGHGIAPADMQKIQEPFFTTKQTGYGLGLAICRSIVAQMRGRFEIDSAPGAGTTVRLLLPAIAESSP
jgi:two-component system NtrC family sensor kinase